MSTKVDLIELQKAADAVFDARSDLVGEWDRIRAHAKELFESRWRGAAAASYSAPWSECDQGFREVMSSLDFLSRALAEAQQQYQRREAENTAAIDNAGSGGGLNLDY